MTEIEFRQGGMTVNVERYLAILGEKLTARVEMCEDNIRKYQRWARQCPAASEIMQRGIEQEQEYIAKIRREHETAQAMVEGVADERYRRLLWLRYHDKLSWLQVADRMHYDETYVCKLDERARAAAADVLEGLLQGQDDSAQA